MAKFAFVEHKREFFAFRYYQSKIYIIQITNNCKINLMDGNYMIQLKSLTEWGCSLLIILRKFN